MLFKANEHKVGAAYVRWQRYSILFDMHAAKLKYFIGWIKDEANTTQATRRIHHTKKKS